jgi:hypothetical protein
MGLLDFMGKVFITGKRRSYPTEKQIREHQYRNSQKPSEVVQKLKDRDNEITDGTRTH